MPGKQRQVGGQKGSEWAERQVSRQKDR